MKKTPVPLTMRLYCGHHKCASQYIKRVMVQSARLMGWKTRNDGLSFVLPYDYHLQEAFSRRLEQKRTLLASDAYDLTCLENADNESIAIVGAHHNYRGFHVIRDPRDIVVSGYFSHLKSHPVSEAESPWLFQYRRHLQSLPDIEHGLLAEIEFCIPYFERLRAWDYQNPNMLELCYETLIHQPEMTFQQIFSFLGIKTPRFAPLTLAVIGIDYLRRRVFHKETQWGTQRDTQIRETLPAPLLRTVLWNNRFQRFSGGRKRGEENQTHHYRKGIAGDWHNYFSPRVKDAFKAQFGDLVIALGYEPDSNW